MRHSGALPAVAYVGHELAWPSISSALRAPLTCSRRSLALPCFLTAEGFRYRRCPSAMAPTRWDRRQMAEEPVPRQASDLFQRAGFFK